MQLPVIFAADNNYFLPLFVSINSLFQNKNYDTQYMVYILHKDFSETNIELIRNINRDFIEFIEISDRRTEVFVTPNEAYQSNATFYRFYIEKKFPQYDKILYLDSDVIVQGDLSDLFDTDIEDYYGAAVSDIFTENRLFEIDNGMDTYFNAGVLLLNLKKFRDENISQILFSEKKDYYYGDQAILNNIIGKKIKYVSEKYNFLCSTYYLKDFAECKKYYSFEDYCTYSDYINKSVILHLAAGEKPWQYKWPHLSSLFFDYCNNIDKKEIEKKLLPLEGRNHYSYFLPDYDISCNSRIILYGAGLLGKELCQQIIETKRFKVVDWVDRDYSLYKMIGWPVNCTDNVFYKEYDNIVIATRTQKVAREIREYLVSNGIDEKKILWMEPVISTPITVGAIAKYIV